MFELPNIVFNPIFTGFGRAKQNVALVMEWFQAFCPYLISHKEKRNNDLDNNQFREVQAQKLKKWVYYKMKMTQFFFFFFTSPAQYR